MILPVQRLVLQEVEPGAVPGDGCAALRAAHAVAEPGHAQRSLQVPSLLPVCAHINYLLRCQRGVEVSDPPKGPAHVHCNPSLDLCSRNEHRK